MPVRIHRRRFFGKTAAMTAAAAGTRLFASPAILAGPSPNSKLNIANIGVSGRGSTHIPSSLAENLVAVCDVFEGALHGCLGHVERHCKVHNLRRPLPKTFADYREMLDKMHGQIDAVVVATPDHHHAPASMMAMKLGMHVYCEKPLTHSIYETRQLALAARQYKVATQLGNQGRADEDWRQMCEGVWAGAIGNVREAHVWTDRAGTPRRRLWPQGGTRPSGADPVPAGLNWDLWLGPAPVRPYLGNYKAGNFKDRPVYQPFAWRGWWDFGTGALGDMGCHLIDGLFSALKIEHVEAVELVKDSGDATKEMFPTASIIRWDIAVHAGMGPCKVFWYDGGCLPPRDIVGLGPKEEFPGNAFVLVGEKGKIYSESGLLPAERMKQFKPPKASIPRCASNHFAEWVTACKGGRPAFSNFPDHGGPLSEMVLLGNLAIRAGAGKKLLWDGPNMKCTNLPELNQFLRREYRKGWTL
jgi:predicted dehydrogenase